ncbi:MAG: hypothetical protein Q4G35_02470 [Propionibacteriaceae bacterium]|nr:hypothetical protein [Propionibacteriaceae bacterium]
MATTPTRLQTLLTSATDPEIVERYFAKIHRPDSTTCWLWTGAISGKGHGRFWIGAGLVVVAHRFGWLVNAGDDVDELPEVVSHSCDNPLCQNPAHLRAATWSSNRLEYLARRGTPGSPLRDKRGSRGRARELRDAAKAKGDVGAVEDAGLTELDRFQTTLW